MADWKRLLQVGKSLAALFLPGIVVSSINAIEEAAGELKGPDKKAAVIKMVNAAVEGVEGAAGKDYVNNAEVTAATSAFIDAYVALANAIAKAKALEDNP